MRRGTTRTLGSMQATSLIRRYCLLAYWLLFAGVTVHQAQYPGLMLHPEEWEYPWRAVLVLWGLLAILIGGLYLIIRPRTYHHSWGRLVGGLVYAAVLLTLGMASVVTDMPGYYYVFAQFSLVTMGVMLLFAVIQIVGAVWRRWTHAA